MIKKTFYFGHDYNARNDEKIIKLISEKGWEGYGIYWAIIEKLYEADGYLDEDYTCIAFDLRTEYDRITTVIKDYNLFEVVNKKISSKSVLVRLRRTLGISEKNRQNVKKRWDNAKIKQKTNNTTVIRPYASGNTIKEKKRKEKKVNKTILQPNGCGQQINILLKEFEIINPTINYGNKTQRTAIENMLKQFGYEKLLNTIKYAVSIQGNQFSPVITTPYQLKENMGKLLIYYKKEKTNKTIIC